MISELIDFVGVDLLDPILLSFWMVPGFGLMGTTTSLLRERPTFLAICFLSWIT
jgi:hypothetical protein